MIYFWQLEGKGNLVLNPPLHLPWNVILHTLLTHLSLYTVIITYTTETKHICLYLNMP